MQGCVLEACRQVLGLPPAPGEAAGPRVRLIGASRTDAGVHALRQVASLEAPPRLPPAQLARALNALLPPSIRVLDARSAPPGFDARRAALGKRYGYLIDRGRAADPFLRRYAWHLPQPLDVGAMAGALSALRGTHDFSAFCAAPGRDRPPDCTVVSARVVARRQRVAVFLSADRFLHHMVRNVVGSLVEVGRGARTPAWLAEALAGRDRTRAGPTAPARGLALVRVRYPRSPGDPDATGPCFR